MEGDIEIVEEVVRVKTIISKNKDIVEACDNLTCIQTKRRDELELKGLVNSQQKLKAELADLFRSKEQYKRLIKKIRQENERLKSELNYYRSDNTLALKVEPVEKEETFEDNTSSDVLSGSISSVCDEQELFNIGQNHSQYNDFSLSPPEQKISDPPSSSSFEGTQISQSRKDWKIGIDKRCFRGEYTPQIVHILEAKFRERSVLSKKTREECSKLTNLSESQITKWFHMRRPKTKTRKYFDPYMLSHLQLFYTLNQFPSAAEIDMLAQNTNLSNSQVKKWFGRQREKQKKHELMQKPYLQWHKLLEQSFKKNPNASRKEIEALQQQTLLSKEQIEEWFQSRRSCSKKAKTTNHHFNETIRGDDFGLPSVCSAAGLEENVHNQVVDDLSIKKEYNVTQDSSGVHDPFNALSSGQDAQEASDQRGQSVLPVFSQAVINCFFNKK